MSKVNSGEAPLPSTWTTASLGEFGSWYGGGTPSKSNPSFWKGLIPWVSPKDMKTNVITQSEDHISQEAIENSSTRLVPAGTVLLVTRSGILEHTLPVALAGIPVTLNQDLKALVPDAGIDPNYTAFALRSHAWRILQSCSKAGTTVASIDFERLKEFELPLPPTNEQRRIVSKLESLLARSRRAKEALDAIPALLERFRQSVLAAAFRGDLTADWRAQHPDVEPASKLLERIRAERRRRWEEAELEKLRAKAKRPKDDSWKSSYEQPQPPALLQSPELPDGWTWASWREVGFSQNGRAFPSSAYCDSGVKLLRPGNLHASGQVRWTPENTRCMPTSFAEQNPDFIVGGNQLVINLTAQSLKDEFLGRVCLTGAEEQCLLNQRIARLTPVHISPPFCLWLFKSPVFRRYVDGLNTGSLIQHMFTSQVDEFVFPLPPHEEQQEIVRRVEMAIQKINALSAIADQSTAQLHQLEKATLSKAFRGELVPQDPNDEPASVLLERIRAEREASDGSTPKRSRGRRPAA